MGTLAENPQLLEPLAHAGGLPAVAIAADNQLMPGSYPLVPVDCATECLGSLSNRLAVFVRSSRVAQRLMRQVASISD